MQFFLASQRFVLLTKLAKETTKTVVNLKKKDILCGVTMAKPTISVAEVGDFRVVKFEIPGGVTSPAEFAEAVAEVGDLSGSKAVLLNGRGPVWGYAMLAHSAHPTPAVATYDPRLGYVVVATHSPDFAVGQVVADPEAKPAPAAVAA